MLVDRSEPQAPPADLPELLDRVRERAAGISDEELTEAFDELASNTFSFSFHLAGLVAKVLGLVFFLGALYVVFKDFTTTTKLVWVGGALGFWAWDKVLTRKEAALGKAVVARRDTLRVALGCVVVGPGSIFDAEEPDDDCLGVLVTEDAALLADPLRLEQACAVAAHAVPPGPEGLERPAELGDELVAAVQGWYRDEGAATRPFPAGDLGDFDAELAWVGWVHERTPRGYVDRALWPVLLFELEDGSRSAMLAPATFWDGEGALELTGFQGPLGQVYAARDRAFQDGA